MAVVIVSLVAMHGIEYLFPTVILCGVIQTVVGGLRLGKLIRLVPHPVMLGFVNGLAIVICLAQLGSFRTFDPEIGQLVFLRGLPLVVMLLLVAMTMMIIWLLPKWTKSVPPSLVAILSVTLLSAGINRFAPAGVDGQTNLVATVGDILKSNAAAAASGKRGHGSDTAVLGSAGAEQGTLPSGVSLVGAKTAGGNEAQLTFDPTLSLVPLVVAAPAENPTVVEPPPVSSDASISGGLPQLFFLQYTLPPVTLATLWIILPFSLTLAAVGLIESLMTLTLIDEITETRGRGNRECIGQGAANILCGMFGGMGGCAMIGQSLINVNSGGRGRLSGITAAVCLLLFILFFASWILQIPMAALVGVMFMVVVGTFEWASLKMFRRMPRSDTAVMVLVAAYTVVMHDLASAVILGVIVSALVFAWKHALHLDADIRVDEHGSKIYQLHGPLFFASVASFKELFDPARDPDDVVIDFYYTRVYDHSGLEAINLLAEKYEGCGKRLHLTHLSHECRGLLDRAGDLVEVNVSEDPQYHIATDRLA